MVGEEEHPYYALLSEVSFWALEEEEERERAHYVSWLPYPSWERKRLRTLLMPSRCGEERLRWRWFNAQTAPNVLGNFYSEVFYCSTPFHFGPESTTQERGLERPEHRWVAGEGLSDAQVRCCRRREKVERESMNSVMNLSPEKERKSLLPILPLLLVWNHLVT